MLKRLNLNLSPNDSIDKKYKNKQKLNLEPAPQRAEQAQDYT